MSGFGSDRLGAAAAAAAATTPSEEVDAIASVLFIWRAGVRWAGLSRRGK